MNFNLSRQEQLVCNYLKTSMTNKEIADKLCVCEKTVKFHLTSIYKKLSVRNRSGALIKLCTISFEFDEILTYPMENKMQDEKSLPSKFNQVIVKEKQNMSQVEKVNFIDKQFMISETMNHLGFLMKEITKEKIDTNTVNAACNCIARMNETINTSIQAARFLNDR